MPAKSPHRFVAPLLAVLLALGAILLGALWFIAPFWQPGYHAARVPFEPPQEATPPEPAAPDESDTGALIDVNTASAEALTALPGIGSAKAAAIVAWREEHGAFASLADLAQIDGISIRMVENWQGLAVAAAQP